MPHREDYLQKCAGKGLRRQGVVWKHRNFLAKEPNYAQSSYALTYVALMLNLTAPFYYDPLSRRSERSASGAATQRPARPALAGMQGRVARRKGDRR